MMLYLNKVMRCLFLHQSELDHHAQVLASLVNFPMMAFSTAIQNSTPTRKETLMPGPDYAKWREAEKVEMDMHKARGTLIPNVPV